MSPAQRRRRPAPARRLGYLIAIAINGALLYIIDIGPGWEAASFLTSATSSVLFLVNLMLWANLAVNVIYLLYDPRWLRESGDLVTAAIALATLVRIWQVFPFVFHGSATYWYTVIRIFLVVGVAGLCISIIVSVISLIRHGTGRGR